ncbi:MAG: glycerol-3-phosphate 1-O-acyltransferase PlsY [Gammaproteobacteria bacterium]|nr:glycerol-3-phosphate 1-O-acyltransferase PlsY [Gammaproteobacteria bacterium]
MLVAVSFTVLAYLAGSLSSAIIVCKLAGLPDPRTKGSGNPGATNVLRLGGKKLAALVLLGDAAKGAIPVILARLYASSDVVLAAVMLAAFLGHLYPVFFAFRGGKGVATAAGTLLALSPPLGLALVAVWLTTSLIFRISSLAALIATLSSPLLGWYLLDGRLVLVTTLLVMSGLLLWRHRSNIRNLLQGAEPRIGRKKPRQGNQPGGRDT